MTAWWKSCEPGITAAAPKRHTSTGFGAPFDFTPVVIHAISMKATSTVFLTHLAVKENVVACKQNQATAGTQGRPDHDGPHARIESWRARRSTASSTVCGKPSPWRAPGLSGLTGRPKTGRKVVGHGGSRYNQGSSTPGWPPD